jgi:hypothetical protein
MNNPDRSGDIVLVMKASIGTMTSPVTERFTCGMSCRSWHGSLNRSDSYVPLILSYPGGSKADLNNILTGVEGCSEGQDQEHTWSCDFNYRLKNIIENAISLQYGQP